MTRAATIEQEPFVFDSNRLAFGFGGEALPWHRALDGLNFSLNNTGKSAHQDTDAGTQTATPSEVIDAHFQSWEAEMLGSRVAATDESFAPIADTVTSSAEVLTSSWRERIADTVTNSKVGKIALKLAVSVGMGLTGTAALETSSASAAPSVLPADYMSSDCIDKTWANSTPIRLTLNTGTTINVRKCATSTVSIAGSGNNINIGGKRRSVTVSCTSDAEAGLTVTASGIDASCSAKSTDRAPAVGPTNKEQTDVDKWFIENYGDKNIRAIQQALVNMGYDIPVDGIYGTKTRTAQDLADNDPVNQAIIGNAAFAPVENATDKPVHQNKKLPTAQPATAAPAEQPAAVAQPEQPATDAQQAPEQAQPAAPAVNPEVASPPPPPAPAEQKPITYIPGPSRAPTDQELADQRRTLEEIEQENRRCVNVEGGTDKWWFIPIIKSPKRVVEYSNVGKKHAQEKYSIANKYHDSGVDMVPDCKNGPGEVAIRVNEWKV